MLPDPLIVKQEDLATKTDNWWKELENKVPKEYKDVYNWIDSVYGFAKEGNEVLWYRVLRALANPEQQYQIQAVLKLKEEDLDTSLVGLEEFIANLKE